MQPIAASLFALALTAAAPAQDGSTPNTNPTPTPLAVAAAFSTFGTGCKGSGWTYGTNIIVPASLATTWGNGNNNIPFSWNPTRYQQVFLGSEIAFSGILLGIGLRQDDQFQGFDAAIIDIELALGSTTLTHTTIGATFAANYNGTLPSKTVYTRRKFALPKMPPVLPTNPADFFVTIPFDVPFPLALPATDNLIVEVVNWGNSVGNAIFTYPLDAGNGTTTRIYASGNPMASSGTVGTGYGHVMALKPLGSNPALPAIYNTNLPKMGTNFTFGLANAKGATAAVLTIGRSNTTFFGIPLPFDMTPVGAPGCSLLASAQIVASFATAGGGDLPITLPIPSDPALDGASFFLQYLILDPGANALGLVTSNGGAGVMGI